LNWLGRSYTLEGKVINPGVAIPFVLAIAVPVGLVFRWFQHRERMAELTAGSAGVQGGNERLERLEQAVEAIAIEVERVGEGQRYLTRVLESRPLPPR